MTQEVAQDHRLLKQIVIGLGFLLVIGFFALIAVAVRKAAHKAPTAPSAQANLPAQLSLTVPAGARIETSALTATELALTIATPEGQKVVILDRKTGAVRQTVEIGRAGP